MGVGVMKSGGCRAGLVVTILKIVFRRHSQASGPSPQPSPQKEREPAAFQRATDVAINSFDLSRRFSSAESKGRGRERISVRFILRGKALHRKKLICRFGADDSRQGLSPVGLHSARMYRALQTPHVRGRHSQPVPRRLRRLRPSESAPS